MSQLKLDNHGKPGGTGRPFRPITGLLSSAHPRSHLERFEPRTHQSAPEHLTSRPLSRHREAGSWMCTVEESHNRTKRPSSASRISMVV